MTAVREQYPAVEKALLHGSPAEQLVSFALGNGIDAIAMATRAHWERDYGFFGSVTDAVVRTAPLPVLLRGTPVAGGPPLLSSPRRFLVPLDGSRLAEQAVPEALELAAAAGGGVLLLQVIDEPAGFGSDSANFAMQELRAAHDYLADVKERYRLPGISLEATVRLGRPAETIHLVALDSGTDLVVMATHGRAGARRERLGSVTLEVLRHDFAPVLVVSAAALAGPAGTASPRTV